MAVLSICLSLMQAHMAMAVPAGPGVQLPAPVPGGGGEGYEISQSQPISLPEHLKAGQRKPLLRRLYARLQAAASEKASRPIVDAIEQLWLTSGDKNIDFIMQNAIMALDQNDYETAMELLNRVIALRPGYAEGWNKRAMVHFMKKQYGPALHDLRAALALDPHHFQALHGLALVMNEIGNKRSALQAYRILLRYYPHFSQAREAARELERTVTGQGS